MLPAVRSVHDGRASSTAPRPRTSPSPEVPLLTALFFVLLGLVSLVIGADFAVGGARRMGRRMGISDLVIGLTVTAIGTSLPELATTAAAAISAAGGGGVEAAGVGVGNVLGSNLFLLLALLGVSGLVRTMLLDPRSVKRDGTALGIATGATVLFLADAQITRLEGILLTVGYAGYLGALLMTEERQDAVADPEADGFFLDRLGMPQTPVDIARVIAGLTVVTLAAAVVVQRGVELAEGLGVSSTLVGVLAGIGTSLPEVVVSLRAASKGTADIAVGNILGSSIANLLLCLGIAGIAAPMPVPETALALDLPFMVAATVVSLALMVERKDVTRAEGVALVTVFALYMYLRATMT